MSMNDYEFNNLDMEVQGAFPNQQRSPENVIGWVMSYLRENDRIKSRATPAASGDVISEVTREAILRAIVAAEKEHEIPAGATVIALKDLLLPSEILGIKAALSTPAAQEKPDLLIKYRCSDWDELQQVCDRVRTYSAGSCQFADAVEQLEKLFAHPLVQPAPVGETLDEIKRDLEDALQQENGNIKGFRISSAIGMVEDLTARLNTAPSVVSGKSTDIGDNDACVPPAIHNTAPSDEKRRRRNIATTTDGDGADLCELCCAAPLEEIGCILERRAEPVYKFGPCPICQQKFPTEAEYSGHCYDEHNGVANGK